MVYNVYNWYTIYEVRTRGAQMRTFDTDVAWSACIRVCLRLLVTNARLC